MRRPWPIGFVASVFLTVSLMACTVAWGVLPEFSVSSNKFAGAIRASAFQLANPSKTTVRCKEGKIIGEVESVKNVGAVRTSLTGCESGFSSCSNGSPGVIELHELKGVIGYTNAAGKEVGLRLEPTVPGAEYAKFSCGTSNFLFTRVVIGVLTPVNVLQQGFKDTYVQTLGSQAIKKFEGSSLEETLFGEVSGSFTTWKSGFEGAWSIETASGMEIKA